MRIPKAGDGVRVHVPQGRSGQSSARSARPTSVTEGRSELACSRSVSARARRTGSRASRCAAWRCSIAVIICPATYSARPVRTAWRRDRSGSSGSWSRRRYNGTAASGAPRAVARWAARRRFCTSSGVAARRGREQVHRAALRRLGSCPAASAAALRCAASDSDSVRLTATAERSRGWRKRNGRSDSRRPASIS